MSTPYNDQWVLHPAGRGRRRRHAVEQLNSDGLPCRERGIGGAERADGAPGANDVPGANGVPAAEPAVAHPPGKLAKRPKWIDRDT